MIEDDLNFSEGEIDYWSKESEFRKWSDERKRIRTKEREMDEYDRKLEIEEKI